MHRNKSVFDNNNDNNNHLHSALSTRFKGAVYKKLELKVKIITSN